MSRAAEFYKGLADAIDERIRRQSPFRATITAVSGNLVQIQPVGATAPLSAWYATVQSPTAYTVGNEVAVVMMSGSPLVIGKILR